MARSQPSEDTERLSALETKFQEDPNSLAFIPLAEELNRQNQHAKAAEVAQRGLLAHPDSVAGRLAWAVAEAEQDNVKEALEQIKRALVIDQENPKALALMGKILLSRGLAKRAMQFLSHAVKLSPNEESYRRLLAEAQASAKAGSREDVPVFSARSVSQTDNPWDTQDGQDVADSKHTLFDPDAAKRLGLASKAAVENSLRRLPDAGHMSEDEEPTAYVDLKEDPREKKTAHAAKIPTPSAPKIGGAKNAKMGGSAAEYSQMMRASEADVIREIAAQVEEDADLEKTRKLDAPKLSGSDVRPAPMAPSVRQAAAPPVPPISEDLAPTMLPPEGGTDDLAPPPGEATNHERPRKQSSKPKKAPSAAKAPASAPVADLRAPSIKAPPPEKKPKSAPKPAPEPARAKKAIGPVFTRMVDEAVWGLFGKKPEAEEPAEEPAAPAAPEAKVDSKAAKAPAAAKPPAKKAPVRAKVAPKESGGGGGVMVVRTSERFGFWTRWAAVLVFAVGAAFLGHWWGVSRTGAGPEVSSEELKGLASDLERGGLAALLAAEDQAKTLEQQNPGLAPLLNAALAEIYARRWASFGRNAEAKKLAEEKLQAVSGRPTLETLSAMVVLSTGTTDRKALREEIQRVHKQYPESPKALVVLANLESNAGRSDQALDLLYRALAQHPLHRRTLLELGRWHGENESYVNAFTYLDRLLERYPTDVEAAIDRYVLGQLSGNDERESEAVSTLAGLVREEIPEVAKDETGRAALAFAVPRFAVGELAEGLVELEKAEAAYQDSPAFKSALGGVFLAVGQFEQAKKHYTSAIELDPGANEARLGLARAELGIEAEWEVDLEAESKAIRKRNDKKTPAGVAKLPFGTVRFVPGRFELVEVESSASKFPNDAFVDALKGDNSTSTQARLHAVSLTLQGDLARRAKKCGEAKKLYTKANEVFPRAQAYSGLGTCEAQAKRWAEAEAAFAKALEQDANSVATRIAFAETHMAQGNHIKAIEALEPIDSGKVLAPRALELSTEARLKRGDFERGLERAQSLTAATPKNFKGWLLRGEIEHGLGRPDDARKSMQEALNVQPQLTRQPDKLTAMQLTYLGQLDARGGKRLLRAAVQREDAPLEAHFYLGKLLVKSRRSRREGRKELERFVQSADASPLRAEAQKLLGKR